MTATFGRLNQRTLELGPGLNVIYAPNESGKSTWAAFIRNMFYGLSTKNRGTLADKNRFAPWDGAPMRGRMDLLCGTEAYTVLRDTQRAASPMGAFSCTYQNTAAPVPGITAQNLGETLLGVPREVFERSAFIRQSGLAVDQDAELEKRIASLIGTGEETVSFSEAYDCLKKQLNRRKHNKTGQIPLLEERIAGLEHDHTALQTVTAEAANLETRLDEEKRRQQLLTGLLQQWTQAEAFQAFQARRAAEQERDRLAGEADVLCRALQQDQVPPSASLEQYEGQLRTLQTIQGRAREAGQTAQQDAEKARRASDAQKAHPLYGQPPEQAPVPSSPPLSPLFLLLSLLCAAGTGVLGWLFLPRPYFALIGLAAVPGIMLWADARRRRSEYLRRVAAAQALLEARKEQQACYAQLEQQARDANERALQSLSAAESLQASFTSDLQALLARIRLFSPGVTDLSGAQAAITAAKGRLAAADTACECAKNAQLRLDMMPQSTSAGVPVSEPDISRQELERRKQESESGAASLQRQLDNLTGQLRLLGDPSETESQLSEAKEQLAALQAEYEAITVALEALESANLTLQNRFSPALGAKAAAIFADITDGQWQKVLLNRDFSLSAEAANDPAARDIQLLSQGASDQLYFAVRMAICDLVLPAEKAVPLILDDALTNFDDDRLAAALAYLRQESARRQILLFTCQKREAALLGGAARCLTC